MKLDDLRNGFQREPTVPIVCDACGTRKEVTLDMADEARKHCAVCEARLNLSHDDYEPDPIFDRFYFQTAPCDFMETRPEDLFRRGGTDHQCGTEGVVYFASNGGEVDDRIALCPTHYFERPAGVILTPIRKCHRCEGKGFIESKIGRAVCPQCPDLKAANYLRRKGWKPTIGKLDCRICGEAGFWSKGVDVACRDHAVRLQKGWDAAYEAD